MAERSKGLTPSGVARRKGRKGLRRSKTLASRRLSKEEVRDANLLLEEMAPLRPATRSDCASAERPCPWVSCRFHLYLDVNQSTGSIKINFPDLEVWEMPETCALDVADRGGITLEDIGVILNLTRERIRQLEKSGLDKLEMEYDGIVGDDV